MPRPPSFKVKSTPDGWRVNVPASLASTGKRSQRFFPTRDKAVDFAKDLRGSYRANGSQTQILSAAATEDAAKALTMLESVGISLTECARFYIRSHDARAKAPSLGNAWDQAIALRQSLSKRHLGALKGWKRRLATLSATNIIDLEPADIEETLSAVTDGTTAWKNGLRYLSVVLNDQVKKGTLTENPCSRVSPVKAKRIAEAVTYEIEQLKSLFRACRDYSDGKDRKCGECAVPFAFLAFAGIRPEELPKLVWANVAQGYVRISGSVAKRDRIRNVRINSTLQSWIDLIPESQRIGRIVPGRWIQRATRVKKEAGLDGRHLQDALRHSFASYAFPLESDLKNLMSDMGHLDWNVYYDHYHNAKTKEEAEGYWLVTPQSIFCD